MIGTIMDSHVVYKYKSIFVYYMICNSYVYNYYDWAGFSCCS